MRRLILAAFLLVALSSCVCAPNNGELVHGASGIGVHTVSEGNNWVMVEFTTTSSDYTHIVQEIYLDSGEVLIECFRIHGSIIDRHSWSSSTERRSMTLYLADVEGADEMHGFAHLPSNGMGQETTVGPNFNRFYQDAHETRGEITRRSDYSFHWAIYADGDDISLSFSE